MARKRVIKKKEAMKAAIEKAQLTEEKKAAEKAQLTEEKKTQSAEEKVAEKVSDTAKEIKATAKTAARTAVKEAKAAKETVKKTAAKEVKGAKEAVKKTAAKRPSKKDMKVRTFVEYYGKQVEEKEMIDLAAIAQSAPGPIAVNAAILVGYRIAGVLGALTTIIGTVLPPFVILALI